VASGPWVKATTGEVWPKPQDETKIAEVFQIRPDMFDFEVSSDIL
jgi:hypothetical protein